MGSRSIWGEGGYNVYLDHVFVNISQPFLTHFLEVVISVNLLCFLSLVNELQIAKMDQNLAVNDMFYRITSSN